MGKDMMKYNVILITIDSLRADRLGCLGYHRKITPNLDKIAGKGCLFSEAISAGSHTPLSFPAIFASIYPFILLHLPDTGFMQIPRECKTVTEILKEQGYNTAAFNSNPLLTFYRNYWRGFDLCEDPLREIRKNLFSRLLSTLRYLRAKVSRKQFTLHYTSPRKVGKRALSFLRNAKRPFFLWIHHMSVHFPYYPPKKFLSEVSSTRVSYPQMKELNKKMRKKPDTVSKGDQSKLIDLYDAQVRDIDHHIGKFMEQLEEMGINSDNTFFIITSDHGDEHGEHGGFLHYSGKLYDELIRVPLIMAGPGLNACKITKQVSLLSLMPTILSLTLNWAPPNVLGDDLLPLVRYGKGGKEYVISEGCRKGRVPDGPRAIDKRIACRSHTWKYIYNEDGTEELYDLVHDPQERLNLRDRETNLAEELKKKILEHLKMEEKVAKVIKGKRKIRQVIRSTVLKI